jgi:hypothetical protein
MLTGPDPDQPGTAGPAPTQEAAMTPYQIYQLFEAERPKSTAEQRADDARRGELAAAISRPIGAAMARMRAVIDARRPTRGFAGLTGGCPQPTMTGRAQGSASAFRA